MSKRGSVFAGTWLGQGELERRVFVGAKRAQMFDRIRSSPSFSLFADERKLFTIRALCCTLCVVQVRWRVC